MIASGLLTPAAARVPDALRQPASAALDDDGAHLVMYSGHLGVVLDAAANATQMPAHRDSALVTI